MIITAKLCQSVITQFRRSVPKYWRLAGLTVEALEGLYADVRDYVRFVEEETGHDVSQSTPWLLDEKGFALAESEPL